MSVYGPRRDSNTIEMKRASGAWLLLIVLPNAEFLQHYKRRVPE